MRTFTTTVILTGIVALTGCASLNHPDTHIKQPAVCTDQK